MRGSYTMRDWEIPYLTKIIGDAVQEVENNPGSKFDFTSRDICPSNISDILTNQLGFEFEDEDANHLDFWFIFRKTDYKDDAYLYLHVNIDTLEVDMFYEED